MSAEAATMPGLTPSGCRPADHQSQSANFRRATESFNHLWYNLRSGNQSALKVALYNFAIVAVVAAIIAVCLVLGPFLKPLLWSVLIGAVLFPFKCHLSFALKRWFLRLEAADTHLLVGVALAPLEALQAIGQHLAGVFRRNAQQIVGSAFGLTLLALFVSYAPKGVACMLWQQIRWAHTLFTNVLGSIDYTMVIALIVVYVTVVAFAWQPHNAFYFMLLGQTLWLVLAAYACSFLGAIQVPVFVASLAYALAGVVYDVRRRGAASEATANSPSDANEASPADDCERIGLLDRVISLLDLPAFYLTGDLSTPGQTPRYARSLSLTGAVETIAEDVTAAGDQRPRLHLNVGSPATEDEQTEASVRSQSELYFRALFLACLATVFYKHVWLLFVVCVPIAVHLGYEATVAFCVREVLESSLRPAFESVRGWMIVRHSAVLPLCLPGVLRLNRKVHRAVRSALRDSIDTASSILMIVLLLVTVIFAGVFCAVEIYSEAITVVQLGNDVVNWTLRHRPELMDVFPEGVTNSMDDVIENAYQYGRTGIGTYVDELLKDADAEQRSQLREQLLSVWDRLIQYWLDRKNGASADDADSGDSVSEQIGEIVNNEEFFTVAQQGLIGWVKKNVDILMDVLNSVWVIVQANLSVLTSICGTLFSLFLGGGQVVITFIINSIIFLTALFYLLSSSGDRYAPLVAANYLGLSSGRRIAEAIEASISSVLFASAKLALFHGLFTWLTHTIVGARVIFLPAVLASVLAAVPFLGTYWCSLPAFLDLWLIQDRFTLGVILLLVHFVFPSTFVDPTIYADVNGGGHAYLTGLSIAGGMFWLGWEGAIFGPMLLCLLVILFNLTSNVLKESPNTPRPSSSDCRITKFRIIYRPKFSAHFQPLHAKRAITHRLPEINNNV